MRLGAERLLILPANGLSKPSSAPKPSLWPELERCILVNRYQGNSFICTVNPQRTSSVPGAMAVRRMAIMLTLFVVASTAESASTCPERYDFAPDAIDFYDSDPAKQLHIRGMERNHMNDGVRSLQRGQTTAAASGDLRFMVSTVPNHPDALALLIRLAERYRTENLPEAGPYTVECWLHRAVVFSPKDGTAYLLYGTYLGRKGKADEAISALEKADSLRPGDINIAYNLGLMYFDKKDYERSRQFAKRAYGAGFPLQGLKKKLEQAGQWVD